MRIAIRAAPNLRTTKHAIQSENFIGCFERGHHGVALFFLQRSRSGSVKAPNCSPYAPQRKKARRSRGTPADDFFDAKVTMLAEMIKHHVKEDEQPGELFVQARQDDTDFAPIFAGPSAGRWRPRSVARPAARDHVNDTHAKRR